MPNKAPSLCMVRTLEIGTDNANLVGPVMITILQLSGGGNEGIVVIVVGAALFPLPVRHNGDKHGAFEAFLKDPEKLSFESMPVELSQGRRPRVLLPEPVSPQ